MHCIGLKNEANVLKKKLHAQHLYRHRRVTIHEKQTFKSFDAFLLPNIRHIIHTSTTPS